MNNLLVVLYFSCFALLAGAAFAMMWANINSINNTQPTVKRHPEAPKEGEEVMYVDLTKDKLEQLYKE